MKKNYYYVNRFLKRKVLPACVLVLSLSACMKERNLDKDLTVATKHSIGIFPPAQTSATSNVTNFGVVSTDVASTVYLKLTYVGEGVSPGATATVAVETDSNKFVGNFNSAKKANYYVLKPENYTLPQTTVNIGVGLKSVTFPVVIKSNTIVNTKAIYALPIVIKDAPGFEISSEYGKHMVLISIKNQYAGNYFAAGTLSFPPPQEGRSWAAYAKTLETIDDRTSKTECADLLTSGYVMRLTVNADNTVNVTPDPTSVNQTITNNGLSIYNPATKTFTLYYKYAGATGDRTIVETLVRR